MPGLPFTLTLLDIPEPRIMLCPVVRNVPQAEHHDFCRTELFVGQTLLDRGLVSPFQTTINYPLSTNSLSLLLQDAIRSGSASNATTRKKNLRK
jgi:hypothetical protein